MNNSLINAVNDFNDSLKELARWTKGLAEITSIMAESCHGQSRQMELFDKFNKFIWDINLKYDYHLKPFYIEENSCESMDNFNYVVGFVNEKFNQKLPYINLATSYDETFDILDLMKEVLNETTLD